MGLLLICYPSLNLVTFAIMSSEVRGLLLEFDPYGGTDPLDMFPLSLQRTGDVLAHLSVVFRRFLYAGSFPTC